MFLYDFPSVTREQAEGVLRAAQDALLPAAFRVAPAQIDFSFTEKTPPHEAAA